jgi:tRNA(fMet)-specific endonuclease VapC
MKKKFLIDTDIIIYWLKNKYPSIDRRIKRAGKKAVFISSITVAELYFGAYNSSKKKENLAVTEGLLSKINIVPFDENAGKYFGEIKASLKRKGRIISDPDIFIAATAFSNNLILVTNNGAHFSRIENLAIENWIS